jgi:hypothetical protein
VSPAGSGPRHRESLRRMGEAIRLTLHAHVAEVEEAPLTVDERWVKGRVKDPAPHDQARRRLARRLFVEDERAAVSVEIDFGAKSDTLMDIAR